MSKWQEYVLFPPQGRGTLPRSPGVYAVYFDGTLVYIGQSVDIANRFSEHKFRYAHGKYIITPWHDVHQDTRITVKVRKSTRLGDWAMHEIRLIHRLQPMFNQNFRKRRARA